MKKLISAAILIALCSDVQADSIWAKRDLNARGTYTDDVARQTGDVLTVIISEVGSVDNKSTRNLKKTTDRSSEFNGELGIGTPNNNILPRMPGFTMGETSSQQTNGQADFKDQRSIVDRVTVIIQDVLPNGNLVIIGSRSREVSGDTQTIQVSGVVRPSDISFDNTIKSEQVADFQIVTSTKGLSEPYRNPGWLGRIFDILWPF